MRYFYLTVLILSVGTIQSGLFLNLKGDVLAIWEERYAQNKATGVVKEKRTFRRFLLEASNNTKLHQNNDTDLAKNKNDKENSTDVENTKIEIDAALSPVFRTEIDDQTDLSPKENKRSHNKTVHFKTGKRSKEYTENTPVPRISHKRLTITSFPRLNKSKATKAKFETRKDKNITHVLKKEKHSKLNFTKLRYETSSGRNKSSALNKKGVTKVFSKVTHILKHETNSTSTKNKNVTKSGSILREHAEDFYVSKDHNVSSAYNNTLKKGRLEKFSKKRHNETKNHKHRDNTPEFRGRSIIESDSSSSSSSFSSDMDKVTWMEEFNDHWMQKKFEALNSTQPRGDVINMAAARPWGVPCGDPDQHDTPWGSCTLTGECEPEYRIYRGDHSCGRTSFVCCALMMTNYDLYQGLDVSMEGSSVSIGSDEQKERNVNAITHRLNKLERMKIKKERRQRKRLIRENIKSITIAFKKILNNAYRNRSSMNRKKTQRLLKFINNMKKQFMKDRTDLIKIHHYDIIKLYDILQARFTQLPPVNMKFMENDTFRKIVTNEKIDREKLVDFLRSQPLNYFMKFFKNKRKRKRGENIKIVKRANKRKPKKRDLRKRRVQKRNSKKRKSKKRNSKKRNYAHARRSGIDLNSGLDEGEQQLDNVGPQNFDYDIEYGILYY